MDYRVERIDGREGSLAARKPTASPADGTIVLGRVASEPALDTVALDPRHLEARRLVAYDPADPRAKPIDLLRRRLLQTMQDRDWHILAVTSPTAGCGSTTTAINLALSMARHGDRDVLLVDMNFNDPSVGRRLGLDPADARDRSARRRAPVRAEIAGTRSVIIHPNPFGETRTTGAQVCRTLLATMKDLRSRFHDHIVVLDMPPILDVDGVLPLLAEADGILLVAEAGRTRATHIDQCLQLVPPANVAQVVLNRSWEA